MLTQFALYHIASGHAFFSGTACLLLALALSAAFEAKRVRLARNLLAFLGAALIAVSAAPLPIAFYAVLLVAMLAWLTSEAIREQVGPRVVQSLRAAAAIACLTGAALEAPYHVMPNVSPMGRPTLAVIGDSVSAGMGEHGDKWPTVFAARYGATVKDHSRPGATVASAVKQAQEMGDDERLVLLEIGGNDVLGLAPTDDYAAGLEKLLNTVARPERTLVMLELPLPPGSNEYGRIQRDAASRHNVVLIPKRVLLGVLEQEGTTLDSVHLSPDGHSQMADAIWQAVQGAYQQETH